MRSLARLARSHPSSTMAALGSVTLLAVWIEFFIIRHRTLLALPVILTAVAVTAFTLRDGRRGRWYVLAGLGVLAVVAQFLWLVTSLHPLWIAALLTSLVLIVATWIAAWTLRQRGPANGAARLRQRAARVGGFAGAGLSCVLSALLVSVAVDASPLAMAVQSGSGFGNSFEPRAATSVSEVNGTQLINDISYGSTYPNSFLDIYIAENDPSVARPTYLVVHGGGFIAGGKSDGDPNAASADSASFALGSGPILDAGYNVVSIDYALAPQVRYPVPVIQLGEAVRFLEERGAEYGLDMSRVVLAGGSAGGHIVSQFAAIQTNAGYAEQMNIEPTMDPETLKAVVLDSAALVPARASRSEAPVLSRDLLFDISLRAYVGTSSELLAESNIPEHVSSDFPPTFIADGNTGSFPDQASELAYVLESLGVRNQLDIPPLSEASLGHGYMFAASPWTDRYNEIKLAFLEDVVK